MQSKLTLSPDPSTSTVILLGRGRWQQMSELMIHCNVNLGKNVNKGKDRHAWMPIREGMHALF